MKKLLALFVLTAFLAVGLGTSIQASDNINNNSDISVVFDKDPTKDGGEKSKKNKSECSKKEAAKCSKKEAAKCGSSKNPEKNCGPKTSNAASSTKSCCSKTKVSKT